MVLEEGHGKRSIFNDGSLESSTDKHKVMWLCPVNLLRRVVGKGTGHSGPGSGASSSGGPTCEYTDIRQSVDSAVRTNLVAEDLQILGYKALNILE